MKKILALGSALLLTNALNARMVTVSTVDEYNKHYHSDTPMVTMYSAEWCGPCKQMKPHFYEAAEATSDVTFCVVDTAAKGFAEIVSGIRSIPTTIFSHRGRQVHRENSSMSRKQIDQSINELRKNAQLAQPVVQVTPVAQSGTPQPAQKQGLEARQTAQPVSAPSAPKKS